MGDGTAGTVKNLPRIVIMSLILAAIPALTGAASLTLPLIICAALAALVADMPGGLPFALGGALLGGLAGYFTGGAEYAIECVATSVLIGAVILLCKRRRAGLFVTMLAVGGAHLLLTAAILAVSLRIEYGSVIEGARTTAREVYTTVSGMIRDLSRDGDTYRLSDADVGSLMSALTTMLPGALLAAWQAIGAAVYFLIKLIRSATGDRETVPNEYKIPDTPIVFFAVSLVISLVLSPFEGAAIVRIAAVDIALALAVPTTINGIVIIVGKIRHPQTVTLPDGTTARRFPVFTIALTAISFFINPFMPFLIAAVYSAASTIATAIRNSRKKDG